MSRLNRQTFMNYKEYLYRSTGIFIGIEKRKIFQAKLDKVLRKLDRDYSYEEFFDTLLNDKRKVLKELFINTMTVNTTEFYREDSHFTFIQSNIDKIINEIPRIKRNGELRVWSSACSTGQEAITLAIILKDIIGDVQLKILATDIDTNVLKKALTREYTYNEIKRIPKYYIFKYFKKTEQGYFLLDEIHKTITYRKLNLMNSFSFKFNFDIIFCRNILIYLLKEDQVMLIDRLSKCLVNNGWLFTGHSEGLLSRNTNLNRVDASVYQKKF